MRKKVRNIKLTIFYMMFICLVSVIIATMGCDRGMVVSEKSDLKTYPKDTPRVDTFTIKDSLDTADVLNYHKCKYGVFHCTATTKDAKPEQIAEYWRDNLGWGDTPGYHWLVLPNGCIYVYKDYDFSGYIKPEDIVYSVRGMNRFSFAVSYIGGLNKQGEYEDTRTEKQKKTLRMIAHLLKKSIPNIQLYGHRDIQIHTNKSCPLFDVQEEYNFGSTSEFSEDSLHMKIMERVQILNK